MYDSPHYAEWKWTDDARLLGGIDLQQGNKTGRFTYLLTGGIRRNEGYRQNDDYTRWNFNGKVRYHPAADTELGAFVNYAYDHRGNWIYWSGLDSALVPPFNSDLTEKIISTKFQSGLSLRSTVNPQFSYLARVHLYRTMFDTKSDTANYDLHPADRTQSTAYAFGAEAQGTWSVHSTDMVVFGVEGAAGLVDSKTFGDKDAVSLALYAQNEWIVTGNVVFSTGFRFDWTRIDTIDAENRVTPRAGITYSPFEGTTLRTSVGTGFRSPSIAERYVSASAGPLSTKPNPDLKSETSISYEVGFKQELPLPAVLDAAVFWTDYDNLVEPTLDATDRKIIFANISEARITGYEIGLLGTVLNGLAEYSVGYTYMYPRDPRTNTPLKYRPRHLLYASSRIQYKGVSIGVDFRFVSRVEAIDAAAAQFIPNADSRVETRVMDARLGYDFSEAGLPLTAVFAINNVFNYNYTEIMANIAPIRQFMLTVEWAM
jgi:iron complex outermembrane receptor protein